MTIIFCNTIINNCFGDNMSELAKIKKIFGESMSHYVRDKYPTILEDEGILLSILLENFSPNKQLYDDIKKNNLLDLFIKYMKIKK